MQLSYATISTLSTNSLLRNHRDNIVSDLHEAIDTLERVEITKMYSTLQGLKTVLTVLDEALLAFHFHALDEDTSIYNRIEESVANIIEASIHDLRTNMFQRLDDQINTYSSTIEKGRQALYSVLGQENQARNLLFQLLEFSMGENGNFVDEGHLYDSYIDLLSDAAVKTKVAVTTVSAFSNLYDLTQVDKTQFPAEVEALQLPTWLVPSRDARDKCTESMGTIGFVGLNVFQALIT